MKERIQGILYNLVLVFGIFFFVALTYVVYIAGPNRAYEKEDRQYLESFETLIGESSLVIESRFSFDTVYYIVSNQEKTELYWFSVDFQSYDTLVYQDKVSAQRWANDQGFSDYDIQYGVFDNQLVYVVKVGMVDYFLDFESQEVLLRLGV